MVFIGSIFTIAIVILFIKVLKLRADLNSLRDITSQLLHPLEKQPEEAMGDQSAPGKRSPPAREPSTPKPERAEPSISPVEQQPHIPPPPKVPPASPVPAPPSPTVAPSVAPPLETRPFSPGGKKTIPPAARPRALDHPPTTGPVVDFSTGLFEAMIDPFAAIRDYAMNTYRLYKEKDKLQVFFLTIMGIITLAAGFGYILQYSFTNILNETVKVLLGFLAAIGIIIVGIRLIGRHEQYRDYGSGLIGLGLILNYICIYFTSTYYGIVSSTLALVLIFINALAAVALALKFETRVVAIVTLFGGAFTPFYLNTEATSPLFYMGYLWLLCAGSVYVSRRIAWKTLATLSFFIGWGLMEFSISVLPDTQGWPAISLLVHLFVYLFLYQSLIDRRGIRETLAKDDILLLAGSLALFLYNHFDLLGSIIPAGLIYLLNAVPFLILGLTSRFQVTPKLRAVILTIGMTLVGFAIPALFNKHLMGLFWGQEALLMVFLGFLFGLPVVRKEGYFLLLIAVGQIAYTLPDIWGSWSRTLWTGGYLNLWVLPLLCFMLKMLIGRYDNDADSYERSLRIVVTEALSFSIATIYLITGYFFLPAFLFHLTIPLAFILLFVGGRWVLPVTRGLGYVIFFCGACKLFESFITLIIHWRPAKLWTSGYVNLLVLAGQFAGMRLFLPRSDTNRIDSHIKQLSIESGSLWAVLIFYTTVFYFRPGPALIVSPLPMFILIYWGSRKALPFTHLLGYVCYALILVQIRQSVSVTHSGYYSDQILFGKIAMVEAFLILWFLQYFYDRWLDTAGKGVREFIGTVRQSFYLLCPLVLIMPIQRHLPAFVPPALWGAVAISFAMRERLKLDVLRYEFYILVACAVLWASLRYFTGMNHGLWSPNGLALLAGIVFLVFLMLFKKGYTAQAGHRSEYRSLFRSTYYYGGWCLFLLSAFAIYNGRYGPIYACPLTALYFIILASLRSRIYVLESDFPFIIRLTQVLILLSLLGVLAAHVDHVPVGIGLPVFVVLIAIGILLYRFITTGHDFYAVPTVAPSGKLQHPMPWVFDLHLFHSMVLMTYFAIFHYLTGQWLGPMVTVALVFHGISLVFQTIRPRYQLLNRLSIVLFAIAGLKLFAHDLADFSLIQKVMVFIVSGAAMLISAYYFQRIKIRLSNPQPYPATH